MLNDLNSFGFVSKELSLIKKFLIFCYAIEYSAIIVSCAVTILFYELTAVIAAFINYASLDWSQLKNRKKKPQVEVIWMRSLLQNEEDVL